MTDTKTVYTTVDTYGIQICSLDNFLEILGYQRSLYGTSYQFKYPVKSSAVTISFRKAVELHNSKWYYIDPLKAYIPIGVENTAFSMNPYQYQMAQSRKVVENVKLQSTKHGQIRKQSDVVKFSAEFYYEQFLGDI